MYFCKLILGLVLMGNFFQCRRRIPSVDIFVFGILFILCAFRGEQVGVDTINYLDSYNGGIGHERHANEFIYYYLIKWIRYWGGSAETCQIVMAFLTFLPLWLLFVKKSAIPSLSIVLFVIAVNGYYFETYNIVRQAAATSFLLWSYVMASEKKHLYSILFYIIALGFHTSSLVYLPLFLIAIFWKFSYKVALIGVVSSLVFAFVICNISFLLDIVSQLGDIDILGFGNYSYFATYRLDMVRNVNGLVTLILPHAFLFLSLYKGREDNLLLRLYFCGIVLLCAVSLMPTSYRIAYGLTALDLLLFPMAFKELVKWRFPYILVMFVFICVLIYYVSGMGAGGRFELSQLISYRFMSNSINSLIYSN